VKLENSFRVALPIESAWTALLDIPAVAPCLPGAELLSVEDENTFRGQVKVKLGPIAVAFQGRARLIDVDPQNHKARVSASGNENKGRGSAQAEVVFALVPDGEATRVDIITDLALAGAVAQYGRAQGVIADVARVIIDSFAKNLQARIDGSLPLDGGKDAPALSALSVGSAVVRGWVSRNKPSQPS